jgi:hypothetical protein
VSDFLKTKREEIAARLGELEPLHRVLPGLAKDGKVVKRDRGWHATG